MSCLFFCVHRLFGIMFSTPEVLNCTNTVARLNIWDYNWKAYYTFSHFFVLSRCIFSRKWGSIVDFLIILWPKMMGVFLSEIFNFSILFETGSLYVAQLDIELMTLLPQPSKCWDWLQVCITIPGCSPIYLNFFLLLTHFYENFY
jgi:hypothetical protein